MKETEIIVRNLSGFLQFLRSKFTIIHNSNFFFRDLHYGVMAYLADLGTRKGYSESEKIAREVAGALETAGYFTKIDYQSWCVNYPEFALPRAEKSAPAAKQ